MTDLDDEANSAADPRPESAAGSDAASGSGSSSGAESGAGSGSDAVAEQWVRRAVAGDRRAVARLISWVEDGAPQLRAVAAALAPYTGQARTVGLTGSPGVGKSTTTAALIAAYRSRGQRVGVLAVDPSSPFTGGALLGDRVRMQEHALDPDVFIRSMATRGHLGGLAWASSAAIRVLEASGCDVVLVETVGVGQSEVEVAAVVDTTVVLLAPGMGDGIQAAKAGILEVGDVYVVNKADRDGADTTARELRHMLSLGPARQPGEWRPPVLKTAASTGDGVPELVEALDGHAAWLQSSGEREIRRRSRVRAEVEALALEVVRSRLALDDVVGRVAAGELDPYTAADLAVGGGARSPCA